MSPRSPACSTVTDPDGLTRPTACSSATQTSPSGPTVSWLFVVTPGRSKTPSTCGAACAGAALVASEQTRQRRRRRQATADADRRHVRSLGRIRGPRVRQSSRIAAVDGDSGRGGSSGARPAGLRDLPAIDVQHDRGGAVARSARSGRSAANTVRVVVFGPPCARIVAISVHAATTPSSSRASRAAAALRRLAAARCRRPAAPTPGGRRRCGARRAPGPRGAAGTSRRACAGGGRPTRRAEHPVGGAVGQAPRGTGSRASASSGRTAPRLRPRRSPPRPRPPAAGAARRPSRRRRRPSRRRRACRRPPSCASGG